MNTITVSELNNQIKATIESTFSSVSIVGEISNLTYASSGHIYFSIKDENSAVSCVMFRSDAIKLKFKLELGIKILIYGNITVYVPRGSYQIICKNIEPDGIGALSLAYEQLKTKLQALGYFDPIHKKPIPRYIDRLYLITSSTGAVIEDMKKVASARWPLVELHLIPTLVQGQTAKDEISKNIIYADRLAQKDKTQGIISVIVIARGGGSIEDLWSFNEEIVANSIYECKTIIVSAIGHESDFPISDMVADKRASTPSNAMEILLPNRYEISQYIDEMKTSFKNIHSNTIDKKQSTLQSLKENFALYSISSKLKLIEKNIINMQENFKFQISMIWSHKQNKLQNIFDMFAQNDPANKNLKRYVQVSKNNKTISIDKLIVDDVIELQNNKTKIKSKVLEVDKF
ncbi:MAG: exodeoxyribonuclease VII large subunit [Campylobacteraceae bacterium 4484_166]|nr:MAG: exodeoxyribonuclease VII large subunit [Campylobacteraceae bacterium 4484_166]